jgi:integrase
MPLSPRKRKAKRPVERRDLATNNSGEPAPGLLTDAAVRQTLQAARERHALALDAVPAPTQEEIDRNFAHAERTLAALATDGVANNTRAALASALRYWAAWHVAALGTELPLLQAPRCAVPGETVLLFIAHHTPALDGESVRMQMPDTVRERLAAISSASPRPVVGRRRVAARAAARVGEGRVDADQPAISTIVQRISLLGMLHERGNLPSPLHEDGRIAPMLRSLRVAASKRLVEALPQRASPVGLDMLDQALGLVSEGVRGIQERAILALDWWGGGRRRSEVLGARIEDFTFQREGGGIWRLHAMKGKVATGADGVVHSVPLHDQAASLLQDWLSVLAGFGIESGPVWRSLTHGRGPRPKHLRDEHLKPGAPLRPDWFNALIQQIAARAGWGDGQYSAHSFRHGFVTEALESGATFEQVAAMSGHGSLSTLQRIYDQRDKDRAQRAVLECLAKK